MKLTIFLDADNLFGFYNQSRNYQARMAQENHKYLFRPPTIPVGRNIGKYRVRQRAKESPLLGLDIINRPRENFFKIFFQRDKYLWVILHADIRDNTPQMIALYAKFKKLFYNLNLPQGELPIVTNYFEFQMWQKQYMCKVAVDESAGEDLFKILDSERTIAVRVVTNKNANLIKRIRKHRFGSKVRGIEDTYDQIMAEVKQDMEKVRIDGTATTERQLQKVRLPNFMKLRLKDKADLIRYRSNLYCLINLDKDKSDMETSKKMFVEQCGIMYTSPKDKDAINYYQTFPFNDTEILRFYTEDCFFYRTLNNTLRIAKSPDQFFIIGDPFNKMFHAIKNIYRKQYPYSLSRKGLKLYRGTDLSQTETQYIETCFGGYIQIHGFVSTTQDLEVAKKFAKQRNHNKIIEIIFEDITVTDPNITDNDYGFVNLVDISRFQEREILFNALNIFKVVGKEKRGDFQFYTLLYGSIFNILGVENPEFLKKNDRLAYYTYKELMGEKVNMEDYGQVFLKSNETQKSVDYYEAKIIEAKTHKKAEEVEFTIKKSQALIQNGQPVKALQTMMLLITERGSIVKTESGARFLQTVLQDKGEIIKEIDITKKYSEAGHSLDKYDEVETQIGEADEALQDALKDKDSWDFDVAFGRLQIKMQLATMKQQLQDYQSAFELLRQAQRYVQQMREDMSKRDISFQNQKKLLLEQTLIYQMMARISSNFEGKKLVDLQQLQQKYTRTEQTLLSLIEEKSYDRSLIEIRKAEIKRHREDFNLYKSEIVALVMNSLVSIKQSSINDSEVPKTYQMLAEIEKTQRSTASIKSAIEYLEKEYVVNTQYYSEFDPKSIKNVIDIAQCHRQLKNSAESLQILKQQIKIVPFKSKTEHTVVTKTLYTMGLAYLDLGEYSYALKCFEKGINMLREILSSKQYQKYHHRYKIEMQMGRTLTFLMKYNEAEERLNSYHRFIVELYKNQHSDIANSLNHFAILYMKWKKYEQSKQKFEQSAEMFRVTSGEKSLVYARIKCNLGMVYAIFRQKDKALEQIDKAKQLFDHIYAQDQLETQDLVHRESFMIYYYYAEIYKMFQEYQEAIEFYGKSLELFEAYRIKKRAERQNNLSSKAKGSISMLGFSMIQSKRDNHELTCKVKIIECQAKLKDFSFFPKLSKIISDIERQIREINKSEQQTEKFQDKGKASQLQNLLTFCRRLYQCYQKKDKSSIIKVSNIGEIHDEAAMIKQIKRS